MTYALDTNVISAIRVRGRNPRVEQWITRIPVSELFTTAPIIAEIERGVIGKERTDPAQGLRLRRWFEDNVLPSFAGRVLPFDLPAARALATFRVPEHAPLDDALTAAIAQSNRMIVATRNTKHFTPLNVECVNPWAGSPGN